MPAIQPSRAAGRSVRRIANPVIARHQCSCWSAGIARASAQRLAAGITVIATSSDAACETDIVIARSLNSCPSSPSMNRIGRKIAMLVSIEASSAGMTSWVPSIVACHASRPCWTRRSTLPCTISAASTTMPVENARPASETMLSVRPSTCSVMTAKNSEIGIDAPITSSARGPRRKYQRPADREQDADRRGSPGRSRSRAARRRWRPRTSRRAASPGRAAPHSAPRSPP